MCMEIYLKSSPEAKHPVLKPVPTGCFKIAHIRCRITPLHQLKGIVRLKLKFHTFAARADAGFGDIFFFFSVWSFTDGENSTQWKPLEATYNRYPLDGILLCPGNVSNLTLN